MGGRASQDCSHRRCFKAGPGDARFFVGFSISTYAGSRSPLHIGQLCRSIAEDHARAAQQRNVTITVEAADAIVEADRDVLRRVMQNLVENALRYVPGRGRILLGAHASDGKVLLEVGNSGPPVPAEIRSLVFEKYGQLRRRTGSPRIDLGLGLYFCRLALEAHGGRIHVEERVDFPTTFVIELPQLRPE